MIVWVPLFVLFFGAFVLVHELGHFVAAKRAGMKVEEFGIGFPPKLKSWRRGETEYSLNAIPLGGFVRVLGEEDASDPRSYLRAPKRWRFVFIVAGCVVNLVVGALLFTAAWVAGGPDPSQSEVAVVQVVPGLPAATAGLQPGDIVTSLGGAAVKNTRELRAASEAGAGKPIPMDVLRNGAPVSLTVTPRATWPQGEGPLGLVIRDKAAIVSQPLPAASWLGIRQTGETVVGTVALPALAIRGLLPSEARPVSVVGIYGMTTQAAAISIETGWWFPFLVLAGSLSAGLGVINLLPIPALDGGRLIFLFAELVRGRGIDPRREGVIHLVGFAALITLMVGVVILDITSPLPSIDWMSLR
jgi:regulator of sigma E protease